MARTFTGSTANRMVSNTIPWTTYPFTIFTRFKCTDSASNKFLWANVEGNARTDEFSLKVQSADDKLAFVTRVASVDVNTVSSLAAISFGVWHTAVVVCASDTSHKLYLDGVLQNEGVVSAAPAGMDRWSVGAAYTAGYVPAAAYLGDMADIALVAGVVSDADILSYHNNNLSPYCVATLVDYWKLGAAPASGLENDIVAGHGALTQVGTTASAVDPTIYYQAFSITATNATQAEGS